MSANHRIHRTIVDTGRGFAVCLAAVMLLAAMLHVKPLEAGWREDQKVFKIGIVGNGKPVATYRRAGPFRESLPQVLDMPAEVYIARDYDALIDAQIDNKVQYGIYSTGSFAAAWARCKCLTPVAAAKLASGVAQYFSVLVADGNKYSSINQMKGKRVAITSKQSLTGYIIPKRELDGKVLAFGDNPVASDATTIVETGSTAASKKALLSGEVDGIFGWSTMNGSEATGYSAGTLTDLYAGSDNFGNMYKAIWQSRPIANGPHAVSNSVPEDIREIILVFLRDLFNKNPLAYDSIERYRGGGFTKVTLSDYQPMIDLIVGKK